LLLWEGLLGTVPPSTRYRCGGEKAQTLGELGEAVASVIVALERCSPSVSSTRNVGSQSRSRIANSLSPPRRGTDLVGLRASRYLGDDRHIRLSIWNGDHASAVIALEEYEARRLAAFLSRRVEVPETPSLVERLLTPRGRTRRTPTHVKQRGDVLDVASSKD
jgi:hypothetical protein